MNVYVEENEKYKLDCSSAIWSTDKINTDYHLHGVSILSDVDFVAESAEYIYLIEYKNGNIPEANARGNSFNPNQDKYINKVTRKFYDSLHYLTVNEKKKPIKYVYIVEYPHAGVTDRKMLRNRISSKLPFSLQREHSIKLIDDFEVVSIDEWNSHPEYSAFPLIPVV